MSTTVEKLSDTMIEAQARYYPPEIQDLLWKTPTEMWNILDQLQGETLIRMEIDWIQISIISNTISEEKGRRDRYIIIIWDKKDTIWRLLKSYILQVLLTYPKYKIIHDMDIHRPLNAFLKRDLGKYFQKKHGAGLAFLGKKWEQDDIWTIPWVSRDSEILYSQKDGVKIVLDIRTWEIVCFEDQKELGRCHRQGIDKMLLRSLQKENATLNPHSKREFEKLGVQLVRKDGLVLERIEEK